MSTGESTRVSACWKRRGKESAAKGYGAARDPRICERVGANVAAVNYHFGARSSCTSRPSSRRIGAGRSSCPTRCSGRGPGRAAPEVYPAFLQQRLALGREDSWHGP